ncbi:hypothetical protein BJX65DRAFT_200931 [Aspergillus insuetus]
MIAILALLKALRRTRKGSKRPRIVVGLASRYIFLAYLTLCSVYAVYHSSRVNNQQHYYCIAFCLCLVFQFNVFERLRIQSSPPFPSGKTFANGYLEAETVK